MDMMWQENGPKKGQKKEEAAIWGVLFCYGSQKSFGTWKGIPYSFPV